MLSGSSSTAGVTHLMTVSLTYMAYVSPNLPNWHMITPAPPIVAGTPDSESTGLLTGTGSKNSEFSSAQTKTSVMVPTSTSVGSLLTKIGYSYILNLCEVSVQGSYSSLVRAIENGTS
jgi:hypothetical protein